MRRPPRSPHDRRSLTWLIACLLAIAVSTSTASSQSSATPPVAIGEILRSEELGDFAELFVLPDGWARGLLTTRPGAQIRLSDFPSAPGRRTSALLTRVDLYAQDAKVYVVNGDTREAPRSDRIHYLGHAEGDPQLRIGLSIDPPGHSTRAWVDGPQGKFHLSRDEGTQFRLENTIVHDREKGRQEPACGAEDQPLPASLVDRIIQAPASLDIPVFLGSPTHSAVVAVDTDSELLDEKFSNNTGAATDWIADLFLEMNVAYERDVLLTLLIGDTFLRPGSPPYDSDPWDVTGSVASNAHLSEFGSYWSSNMGGVDRVFAMLLSGKSSSGNSASGIAWVDGYCETQSSGGGYSVTHVFTASFSSAGIVAHELGHNAGSPHTHCYSPEVDQCYNAESGCYAGSVSCPSAGAPAGTSGTVMSYCNFSAPSGASCGQNALVFHPTVSALFDTFIADHSPVCVQPLVPNEEIFSDGFESGDTSAWTSQ